MKSKVDTIFSVTKEEEKSCVTHHGHVRTIWSIGRDVRNLMHVGIKFKKENLDPQQFTWLCLFLFDAF